MERDLAEGKLHNGTIAHQKRCTAGEGERDDQAGGRPQDALATFKTVLSRGQVLALLYNHRVSQGYEMTECGFESRMFYRIWQVEEAKRIVEALEQLKLPDEAAMNPRELACWHENKKTIMNSLKTLSSQIYSATTRILYEIIQNADDCSFEREVSENDGDDDDDDDDDDRGGGGGGGGGSGGRALRELHLECSEDALVAFHNETGFQPKDLYSLCQVGESSKAAGSGKIGRKGIGFKSVFQICDRPVVLSPPFQVHRTCLTTPFVTTPPIMS